MGAGDGSFNSETRYATGSGPQSLAVGDLDADGALDLVTANSTSGDISVLLGNGDGTFALPIDITSGSMPMGVASEDFNDDGRPDLAIANSGSDNVSVLLNDGNWPALDAPSLSISDATPIVEGNSDTTTATFTVTLSRAYNRDVTVRYQTADGGDSYYWSAATAGSDYEATSGEVTIPAGQRSATIIVAVKGDKLAENNEAFSVKLTRATNAFIADPLGLGIIEDDEPRITIDSTTVTEGNTGTKAATFTVRLSAPSEEEVRVNFSTAEGDTQWWNYGYYDYYYGYYYPPAAAGAGSDFESQSGTVVFAPGQIEATITVQVKGDRAYEGDEVFSAMSGCE